MIINSVIIFNESPQKRCFWRVNILTEARMGAAGFSFAAGLAPSRAQQVARQQRSW
jgi:hypothetical protein